VPRIASIASERQSGASTIARGIFAATNQPEKSER
jgi:hypothetical protein